jgi:hypothetical protein
MRTLRFLAPALLAACTTSTESPGDDAPPPDPTVVYLTPTQHLTRASMALRGLRPSIEDLKAVDADPELVPAIVDRYLGSPELAETIMELENETLLLRIEQATLTFPLPPALPTATALDINGSVFDEPLRLIADIVMSDQPYTKIVTANYTLTNNVVSTIWGLPHTGPAEQWSHASATDGRGAAGILGIEALYHRWRSTGFNYNRGRANMISRSLLCHDYLHADIDVDTTVDLSDPDVVANAVIANPSCAGCHQTLDPLASYLFPFRGTINLVALNNGTDTYPVGGYTVAQETRWKTTNKRPPMFFGTPATSLAGLGQAIADDPRFARCTAMRFASYLTEVPRDQLSGAWIAKLQSELVATNFSAKKLARAIVLSDEFRVSYDTDATAAETVVGAQKARPDQLERMLRDITGFRWTTTTAAKLRGIPYGTPDLLKSDLVGFRVLGGGIDSYFVTEPVHTMNATSSLVAKSAAAAAADFVVEHDFTVPAAQRTLFVAAAVTETDETKVRAELAHLHARIYGELVAPDSSEVDDSYALFTDALAAAGNPRRAWKLTLIGMLSDFRSLFY